MSDSTTPHDGAAMSPASAGSALALAIRFHEAYERLAPRFGYETRPETRNFDPQSQNGRLMVAVCREIIEHNDKDQERRDMNTDNTNRDAEPSPASAGSHEPVAWAVVYFDEVSTICGSRQDCERFIETQCRRDYMTAVPLYRNPDGEHEYGSLRAEVPLYREHPQPEVAQLIARCEEVLAASQYWCKADTAEGHKCVQSMREVLGAIYDFTGKPGDERVAMPSHAPAGSEEADKPHLSEQEKAIAYYRWVRRNAEICGNQARRPICANPTNWTLSEQERDCIEWAIRKSTRVSGGVAIGKTLRVLLDRLR